MCRLLVLIVTLVSAVSVASASAGCGDGPGEPLSYLVATPAVKAGLLAAYLKMHPELARKQVVGPLPDRTFYGSYGGEYAVATFAVSGHVTAPVIFNGDMGSYWNVLRETLGGICLSVLPRELVVSVWQMRSRGGGCYAER
jgi:hypothetical protein